MTQGLTGAVTGAASRQANTASTANMTLPAAPMVATYPITGVANITSITAGQSGQVALLEFASTGCRVVMGGNLLINGDYLSIAGGILTLVANGSNWEEVARTSSIIQPYNACANGDFRGWQRPFTTGSQFTSVIDAQITADCWVSNKSGTAVWDVVRDTSIPAVAYNMPATQYSYKINVTTADASLAATDLYAFYTRIEGYDAQPLANGFAVSWWAKAHRTGTYCLSFANRAFNRSYIVEYNIAVADTWQYFTAVVPAPTGTWNYDTLTGMYCLFSLATGSNFGNGAAANTWLTTGSYATANQVNGVAATSDTFSLWGLNVVPGTVPQPIATMPFALQIVRLRRYCQKIGSGSGNERYATGTCSGTTLCYVPMPLDPPMLGTPTATFSAAAQFGIFNGASLIPLTAIALSIPTPTTGTVVCTTGGSLTSGSAGLFMDISGGLSFIIYEANPA